MVSTITERVPEEQQARSTRPLASHYVAVFVDAIHVKVRDGAVANGRSTPRSGVDLHGHRDVLGICASTPDAWGVVEVLDLDPDGAEEPWRGRHLTLVIGSDWGTGTAYGGGSLAALPAGSSGGASSTSPSAPSGPAHTVLEKAHAQTADRATSCAPVSTARTVALNGVPMNPTLAYRRSPSVQVSAP